MNPDAKTVGVVILYNETEHMVKGEPGDLLAEQGVIACAQAVCHALEAAGYRVAQLPIHTDLEPALLPYPPTDWIVFNLCEGLEGRLFEEARLAWSLEAMGYRFTGSRGDAIAVSVHKARSKAILEASRVATPQWWIYRHPDDVDRDTMEWLPFPLIVKPIAEDASLGVGPEAVVSTICALRDRVAYIVEHYRQAALAEVFIVGREFNVALWGDAPDILPLAEVEFGAFADPYTRLVSFAAKWDINSFEFQHMPVVCPARVEPELEMCITLTAQQAWAAIGCRNYARVDVRVSEAGIPYVIEVNCNPDLSPDAGFSRSAQAGGYSYRDMVLHIVELTLRQQSDYDRDSFRYRWPIHLESDGGHQTFQRHRAKLRRRTVERISR
jgi:D-alanine-D-alanine ligase